MDSFNAISEAMKVVAKKKEDLHKAFENLISHCCLASLPLQWQDIEAHFELIEKDINEKLEKLSEKEKFMPKLEMIQEKPEKPTEHMAKIPVKTEVSPEKTVGNPAKTENTPAKPENSPAVNSKIDTKPRPILKTVCKKMDSKGLLKFIIDHQLDLSAIQYELPMAFRLAPNPANLVLDCVLEFYPPKGKQEISNTTRTCVLLLESLSIIEANRNPDIKVGAKKIVGEWRKKVNTMIDSGGGTPRAALTFLRLLVTYGLAYAFDADDLFECISLIGRRKEVPDLCRALDLSPNMPGFIKKLISRGKYIEAVNFVYAFGLVDKFEPVTYLTSYMRENKKAADEILSIGKRSVKAQNKAAEKEMSGLRAVIKCAKEHGLQDRIFCDDLKKRIAHLHESMMERNKQASSDIKNKKKRARIDHAPGPTLASSPGPDGPMGFFGLAQGHIEMPPVYSYPGEKQVVGSYGHGGSSPYERPAGLGPCLSSLSGSHRSQAPMSRTQLYSEESRMSGGLPYLAPTCGSGYGTPTNRGSCSYGAAPVGGSAFYSTSAIAKSGSYMAEPASASGAYGTMISGGTGSFRVEPIGGSGSNHAMPIGGSGSYRVAPNGGSGSYGTGPPLVSGSYDSGPTSGSRSYGSEAMNGSGSYRGLGSYDGYFYGGAVSLLTSNDDCSRMSQAVQMCPHNGVRF